jgi:hypothetical protein
VNKGYLNSYPKNIFFTENFSAVKRGAARNVQPWGMVLGKGCIPPDQNKISRVILALNSANNTAGALITSLKDNDYEVEAYLNLNKNQQLMMYNIETDSFDGGYRVKQLTQNQMKALKEVIIAVKFQNGSINFADLGDIHHIENQYNALVEWIIKYCADLDKAEHLFMQFMSQNRINSKYEGSDIQRAFIEARKCTVARV